jgi:hypothetical protein
MRNIASRDVPPIGRTQHRGMRNEVSTVLSLEQATALAGELTSLG